ncbi:MAG TPA: SIMPL domain-containing protein [Acidobacteriaceae bacterium]|jgi:hypothetical protein|nr:SIMPL domain-containing protein [Acidobacteriaceae bacterium]
MTRNLVYLIALSFLTSIGSTAWTQCSQNCPERRTISVVATDSATADADLAIMHVGYRVYGQDAKTAYSNASKTSNAIMQALTGSGVPKTAIESSSQLLQPTTPYELQQIPMDSEKRFTHQFTVTQAWLVRVKPGDAGNALNTAINAGANESGWIEWSVQDQNALIAQASAKALADAHMIAEQMAQKLNVHLGHLVTARENQNIGMMNNALGGIVGGMMPSSTQPLAINSRRIECKISMYAVFSIE